MTLDEEMDEGTEMTTLSQGAEPEDDVDEESPNPDVEERRIFTNWGNRLVPVKYTVVRMVGLVGAVIVFGILASRGRRTKNDTEVRIVRDRDVRETCAWSAKRAGPSSRRPSWTI